MRSLIIGYGVTGRSFERFLLDKNQEFDIFDEKFSSHVEQNKSTRKFSNVNDIKKYKKIFISPGIKISKYFSRKELEEIELISDLDLFFMENKSFKIGVTGTNGKSTFVAFLNQYLSKISSSIALGNIGTPLLDNIKHDKKYSVIEVSSFQLEKMSENYFDLSVITNIQIDHLDFHENFENYKRSKMRICADEKTTFFLTDSSYEESVKKIANHIEPDHEILDINFQNLPYRLQKIRTGFINDSKSTNSYSLKHAILRESFNGILLMCGDPKKEKYKELTIEGPAKILIFGKHRNELKKLIKHHDIEVLLNLQESFERLKVIKHNHDVLFSPGNPSGEDFNNYIERGKAFNNFVEEYFE